MQHQKVVRYLCLQQNKYSIFFYIACISSNAEAEKKADIQVTDLGSNALERK